MVYVIVPIVFWLFVAGVSITPLITDYKRRRGAQDILKAALERGQELSPEMLKHIGGSGHDEPVSPANLMIGGIIVSSIAAGAAIVATIFLLNIPVVSPYVYAGAAMMLCVGVGLMIGAKVLSRHQQANVVNQSEKNTGT